MTVDTVDSGADSGQPSGLGIEAPRSRTRRPARSRSRSNFELHAWIFMRISGIVLVVLVLGHLLIMNILDGGVQRINWGFVAGRWSSRRSGGSGIC